MFLRQALGFPRIERQFPNMFFGEKCPLSPACFCFGECAMRDMLSRALLLLLLLLSWVFRQPPPFFSLHSYIFSAFSSHPALWKKMRRETRVLIQSQFPFHASSTLHFCGLERGKNNGLFPQNFPGISSDEGSPAILHIFARRVLTHMRTAGVKVTGGRLRSPWARYPPPSTAAPSCVA